MIAADMADRVSHGTAMTSTPMPTIEITEALFRPIAR